MREYGSAEIRNVAVVGHGASGKTTLVDALAFVSGASKRHGSIKEGTALTDFTPEEIDRKYSINLGCDVDEVGRRQRPGGSWKRATSSTGYRSRRRRSSPPRRSFRLPSSRSNAQNAIDAEPQRA